MFMKRRMSMKRNNINKMEYGYIRQKKRTLLLQMCGILGIGVLVFLVGLLLNKGELANIFTVVSILFVLPAARYLTVWILIFPYHSPKREEYEKLSALAKEHGLLLSDLVFTSSERAMHLDYMVLAGGQAYCYVETEFSPGRQDAEKDKNQEKRQKTTKLLQTTERYLNDHFAKEKFSIKAKIWEDYAAFEKAVRSHTLQEGELEEQETVRDSMAYFMV